MIRLAALVAALMLPMGGAWAQSETAEATRPPEKPAVTEGKRPPVADDSEPLGGERPADRPSLQEQDDTAPAQAASDGLPDDGGPVAAPSNPDPAEPEEPEEPAGPPVHQTLRESDFDYSACLLALHDLGTVYEELPAITDTDQRDCGISRPLRVTHILPGVTLAGGANMRCDTARALGFWLRDFVRPAAGRMPGAPSLSGLQMGTTYDCRGRIGTGGEAKLSEHAYGNAIDIASFTFRDAEPIPVAPREDSGDLIESFQRAVRGAACLYFSTVLGPGSNAAHDDHLHLDVAARNGGWRLCQ
ncbi:extensin family protein [Paracoccus tegillarcae]|nr:extensin family protein [Paracoccus tegillarcae]